MSQAKRATVYFEPVCTKSVRRTLAEDAEDLAAFEQRAKEPVLSFEEVLKDMKRRGKL